MTEFQFKTKPYHHQLKWLEDSKDRSYYAIFGDMGTGKSKHAMDLAAYLFSRNLISQVLIITKNGVDQQFIEEAVPTHLALDADKFFAESWNDNYGEWRKFNKHRQFLIDKLIIVAVNCEALATKKGFAACKDFALNGKTLLIVDESQEFSGLESLRSKNLFSICKLFPYRRIMTGTPTGGNPLHMYAQMQILSDKIFPFSKWSFEYKYCVKEKQHIWIKDKKTGKPKKKAFDVIKGYKALDELQEIIAQHSSRVLKKDCLDLPEKIYKKITFSLSVKEMELYTKLKNSVLTELAPGKFIATEMAITKLIRLQQVSCGFVSFEDLVTGERAKSLLPEPSRLKALDGVLDNIVGKALIWASFTTSIDQIMSLIINRFGEESVVRYDGTVSSGLKQANKIAFKTDSKVRFLVGHPKAGGVGLDLPEASTAVYYSNDYHLISRLQSEDRCHRIGTKSAVTYVDLVAQDTVDNKILTALQNKYDIASQLTGDILREWIK